jgi:broad specificity phosphatase PhoE
MSWILICHACQRHSDEYQYIMGFDKSFTWKISIDNTSVTKLYFNEAGWGLDYINNTAHLIE